MPDFEQNGCRAYPLVDHITDKIVATFGSYGSSGGALHPLQDSSTWVAIAREHRSRRARRWRPSPPRSRGGAHPPRRFDVPDRGTVVTGLCAEARRSLLDTAGRSKRLWRSWPPFVDPLLDAAERTLGSRERLLGVESRPIYPRLSRAASSARRGSDEAPDELAVDPFALARTPRRPSTVIASPRGRSGPSPGQLALGPEAHRGERSGAAYGE